MGSVGTLGTVASVVNPVAALGTVGSVAGPIASVASANAQANATRDANSENVQLARDQMAFQERMSNTAFQRATADMKAAGINPMLAATAQESSPSGSLAQVNPVTPGYAAGLSAISPAATSAKDTLGLLQNIRESNSRIAVNKEQAFNLLQSDNERAANAMRIDSQRQLLDQDVSAAKMQNSIMNNRMKYETMAPGLTGLLDAVNARSGLFHSAASLMQGSAGLERAGAYSDYIDAMRGGE